MLLVRGVKSLAFCCIVLTGRDVNRAKIMWMCQEPVRDVSFSSETVQQKGRWEQLPHQQEARRLNDKYRSESGPRAVDRVRHCL